jgi:hypothetical protein
MRRLRLSEQTLKKTLKKCLTKKMNFFSRINHLLSVFLSGPFYICEKSWQGSFPSSDFPDFISVCFLSRRRRKEGDASFDSEIFVFLSAEGRTGVDESVPP